MIHLSTCVKFALLLLDSLEMQRTKFMSYNPPFMYLTDNANDHRANIGDVFTNQHAMLASRASGCYAEVDE